MKHVGKRPAGKAGKGGPTGRRRPSVDEASDLIREALDLDPDDDSLDDSGGHEHPGDYILITVRPRDMPVRDQEIRQRLIDQGRPIPDYLQETD